MKRERAGVGEGGGAGDGWGGGGGCGEIGAFFPKKRLEGFAKGIASNSATEPNPCICGSSPPPLPTQVPARPEYLDSHDAFLLLHPSRASLFVWGGALAPPHLICAANAIGRRLVAAKPLALLSNAEGEESSHFWEASLAQVCSHGDPMTPPPPTRTWRVLWMFFLNMRLC